MNVFKTVFVLIGLALFAPRAAAVDLTKIDRTIAKEPVYKSQPKYCLLVFGPEAKTRVWLVLDGHALYVDRNGNGDLTDAGERVTLEEQSSWFRAGDIADPAGRTVYTKLRVWCTGASLAINMRLGAGKVRQAAGSYYDRETQADLRFSDRPQDAPVIHFNGPLTLALFSRYSGKPGGVGSPMPALARQGNNWLYAVVGTPGLGQGTFATLDADFPKKFGPVVEVEFPTRDPLVNPIKVKTAFVDHTEQY